MAEVKIKLSKGETPEEAEDLLYKALESKRNGSQHGEEFDSPAMQSIAQKLISLHEQMYQEMLREVNEELDSEYEW